MDASLVNQEVCIELKGIFIYNGLVQIKIHCVFLQTGQVIHIMLLISKRFGNHLSYRVNK